MSRDPLPGGPRPLSGAWASCGKLGTGAPVRVAISMAQANATQVEAILYSEGTVVVQRRGDHSMLRRIDGAAGTELALSPDGARVAVTGPAAARLAVWGIADGALLFEIPGAHRRVVFGPDGQELLAVTGDGTVVRRRAGDGALLEQLGGPFLGPVVEPGFSPDGASFGVYDSLRAGVTWFGAGGDRFTPIGATTPPVAALLSPNGQYLATVTPLAPVESGRADYVVDAYDAAAGAHLWNFGAIRGLAVPAIAFSATSDVFVASLEQHALAVVAGGMLPFLTNADGPSTWGYLDQMSSLAVDGSGLLLADASGVYGAPRDWGSARTRVDAPAAGQGLTIMAMAFSPDGKWLATAGYPFVVGEFPPVPHPGDVTVWELATRTTRQTFHGVDASSLTFSSDSRRLLVTGASLKEYPLYGGDAVERANGGWLSAYDAGEGSALLSSYTGIDLVAISDPPGDRELLADLPFLGFAPSPDRRFIATTGPALWRAGDLGLVWPASAPPTTGRDPGLPRDNWATFSPDGAMVLTSEFTSAAAPPWTQPEAAGAEPPFYATATRLWRASDGALLRDFGAGMARRPAFSPDGAWIVAAGRVHAVARDAAVDLPLGGLPAVSAFGPDGTIAVGRADGVVELFCPK